MFSLDLVDESRRMKALSRDLTPFKKDDDDSVFFFFGSEGRMYETTLNECTCPDFAIQGGVRPCKHMIRMAMEQGLCPSDGMVSDPEAASARYYLGILREFVRTAPLYSAVKAVQLIDSMSFPDDTCLAFAGVPVLTQSGLFTTSGKKQKIVQTKAAKKELEGLRRTLITRLGTLIYDNLNYGPIMDIIKNISSFEEGAQ